MNYSDISVVIRGLIVGNGDSDPKKQFTKLSLLSVRKHLPGAQIILSTWKGSDVSGLDYDEVVFSDPPTDIFFMQPDGTRKFMAINNQIITAHAGLERVTRPFALLTRSDMTLTGTSFIQYFEQFNQDVPGGIVKKRIVMLPTYNPRRSPVFNLLFNPSDWFYFGLAEDVKKLFNIPLMGDQDLFGEKIDGCYKHELNYEAEQYTWSAFVKKYTGKNPLPAPRYYSDALLQESEESYVRNTIMVPAPDANLLCLKMPFAGYGARPILSQGLYTFQEYKKLYNRYSDKKIVFAYNPFENFAYTLALGFRVWLRKLSPKIYKKFVNHVRKSHGSQNLLK